MARYVVLRVESTKTAEKLVEKFDPVESVEVVGLFPIPVKFCDNNCENPLKKSLILSQKWGLYYCPICKQPKQTMMHRPRNLLEDPELHPKFRDMHISVWEPFHNNPEEKYGDKAILAKKHQVADAAERVYKSKKRRMRKSKR